ncbi:hypothetical protein EHQ12_18700 [Leptospira gomenensis]|uniref:Uncharacterized protein n=1 Tax=Leptospira gomenensis TaxID=2484974 RepID=A0A5F1YSR1_9LEPT|nr:hypothetical protein [Leptospira gomenensis]TGK30886.1 hypothetical protein EHQ17_14245 [Leptospira gomenensis]TGK32524.1 hypothetical protein EHQ12_18700 [Leptospira gomenensis]TGK45394.1 hypothetical protein EHQ07_10750 [Leptospira gomenensis]TGK60614.1 hypothetical protein EHQ13_11055 [Leptospira gomenensis]
MENFLKTILFFFYFCVLLFLVVLDIRWDQKKPVQIPSVSAKEVVGKRSILVSVMDFKKMVFQELDASWDISRKKNVFYERNGSTHPLHPM